MRLFFALQPAQADCLAIASFRERMLPPLDRPVPLANLHVTLAFLGDVKEQQLEALCGRAREIDFAPFELTLDELGYWPKPGILWIGASVIPKALSGIVHDINAIMRQMRIHIDRKAFRAHVTLARKCQSPPPAGAMPPDITMHFDSFALVESTMRKTGVRYDAIDWFSCRQP